MELLLIRHAIAEERDPLRWPDDALRPLSDRGRRRFGRAAAGLRRLGVRPQLVLSSPFARAWATAEILAEEAGWPEPVALDAATPGNRPARLLAEIERAGNGEARTLALIGHEPDLGQLASFLLTGVPGSLAISWRKGAVARLSCPNGARPGTAQLEEFLPPRLLRRIGDRDSADASSAPNASRPR